MECETVLVLPLAFVRVHGYDVLGRITHDALACPQNDLCHHHVSFASLADVPDPSTHTHTHISFIDFQ